MFTYLSGVSFTCIYTYMHVNYIYVHVGRAVSQHTYTFKCALTNWHTIIHNHIQSYATVQNHKQSYRPYVHISKPVYTHTHPTLTQVQLFTYTHNNMQTCYTVHTRRIHPLSHTYRHTHTPVPYTHAQLFTKRHSFTGVKEFLFPLNHPAASWLVVQTGSQGN